jgi:hypothetical protein
MHVITDMKQIHDLISEYSDLKGFVFRGHADTKWKLNASVFRANKGQYIDMSSHLDRFKKYLLGRVENVEKMSEYEIWAMGQHHGLLTPFLDWTISPAVALFFAFSDATENKSKFRVMYALNAEKVNRIYCEKVYHEVIDLCPGLNNGDEEGTIGKNIVEISESEENPDELTNEISKRINLLSRKYLRCFSPKRFCSERIIAQRGLFTFTRSGLTIDKLLKDSDNLDLLTAYAIDSDLKPKILAYLDAVNISHLTLFPDISGAAQHTNTKIKFYKNRKDHTLDTIYWM